MNTPAKIIVLLTFLFTQQTMAQNVGVGTQAPQQKLDVNGKLKIGNDNATPQAGTVRFNNATRDFEGYTGTEWKSLTASYADAPLVNIATQEEEQGYSVAVHGDFAVVGAPKSYAGSAYINTGQAYVFRRVNKSWQYLQTLNGSQVSARFGTSVAINDQYIIVGGPVSYSTRGSITVYKKVNNQFEWLGVVQASTPIDLEYFGSKVSLYGNYMAIGCRGHFNDLTPNAQGSVYVFTIINDAIVQRQRIANPTGISYEEFGLSLAIDSTTLVIGAANANDNGELKRGKVYVYKTTGANTYAFSNMLKYIIGTTEDNFGKSIALHNNTVVIGAPGFDVANYFMNVGSIFMCAKDGSGNYESVNLRISTQPFDLSGDNMGKSIAIWNDLIITGSNSGVFQYTRDGAGWAFHRTLSNGLPGIATINAFAVALYEQTYGIGDPAVNTNKGRVVFGDCRY